MLIPTSNILLQTGQKKKKSSKQKIVNNINTIKIDFRKMAHLPSTEASFTQCKCCQGIVVEKNKEFEKIEEEYHWLCEFCKKKNITKSLHYSQNNVKFLLQKNIANQILPPILLFVIDCSGSMNESLCVDFGANSDSKQQHLITLSQDLKSLFDKSEFSKKQEESLKELQEQHYYEKHKQKYKKYKTMKGNQYKSKIQFFMAIIEDYLRSNHLEKMHEEFRVGFVFFNTQIYILKGALQKSIPVLVSQQPIKEFPYKKQYLNFSDFDNIFEKGKQYDRYFADSQLKNFDVSKVAFEHLKIQNQTALGPALALSLGILSVHDIGSRIILVTDQLPNEGILSDENTQKNQFIYKRMLSIIEEKKATLGILNCFHEAVKLRFRENKLKVEFDRYFLKANAEIITEINMQFTRDDIQHKSILERAKSQIKKLLNNSSFAEKVEINLLTSNLNAKINNYKYDLKDYQVSKFIGLTDENWVELNVEKIKEVELLFPVVTQIVIKYNDVVAKEKCLFMSYTSQKVLNEINQAEEVTNMELNNGNLKQIEHLQKLYFIERESHLSNASSLTLKSYRMLESIPEEEELRSIKYEKSYIQFKEEDSSEDDDDQKI